MATAPAQIASLAGHPRVLLSTTERDSRPRCLMADLLKRLDPAITVLMIEHDMDRPRVS